MISVPHFAVTLHVPNDLVVDDPEISLSAFIERDATDPFAVFTMEHVALVHELANTHYKPEGVLTAFKQWRFRAMTNGFHVQFDGGVPGRGLRYTVMFIVPVKEDMQRVEVKALHHLLCIGPQKPAPQFAQ